MEVYGNGVLFLPCISPSKKQVIEISLVHWLLSIATKVGTLVGGCTLIIVAISFFTLIPLPDN